MLEVAEAIGVPRPALHAWLLRGHVVVPSEGQGRARRFSFDAVVELAMIAELTRLGMTISAAAATLDAVRGAFREVLQDRYGAGQVLALDAERGWILPEHTVPRFMADQGIRSYAVVVIANVANDVHKALTTTGTTATLAASGTLSVDAAKVSTSDQRRQRKTRSTAKARS